jgi:hypothetical protein
MIMIAFFFDRNSMNICENAQMKKAYMEETPMSEFRSCFDRDQIEIDAHHKANFTFVAKVNSGI